MRKRLCIFIFLLMFIFPAGATLWGCSFEGEPEVTFSYEIDGNDHVIYYEGEDFNLEGYVLKIKNDQTKEVKEYDLSSATIVSAPDMSTTGQKTITVSYNNKNYTFTINVESAEVKNQLLMQKVNEFIENYKKQNKIGDVEASIDVNLLTKYFSENGTINTKIDLFKLLETDVKKDRLYDFLYSTIVKNTVSTNPNATFGKDSYNYTFGFDILSAYNSIASEIQNFDYVDYFLNDFLFPGVKFDYVQSFSKDICNTLMISLDSPAYDKIEELVNAKFIKVLNQQEIDVAKFVDKLYTILQEEDGVATLTVDLSKIIYNDLQNNREHFISELYEAIAKHIYYINDSEYDEEYYNLVDDNIPTDLKNYLRTYIQEYKKLIYIIEDYVFGNVNFEVLAERVSEQTGVIHNHTTVVGVENGYAMKYETPYSISEIILESPIYGNISDVLGLYQEDLKAYIKEVLKTNDLDKQIVGEMFKNYGLTENEKQTAVNLIWDLVDGNPDADYEGYAKFVLDKIGFTEEDAAEIASIIFDEIENPAEDFISQIFKFGIKDDYKFCDENGEDVSNQKTTDFLNSFNEAVTNHFKIYEKLIREIFSTGSFDFNEYVYEIRDALKVIAELEDERALLQENDGYVFYKLANGGWTPCLSELADYKSIYEKMVLYNGEVYDFIVALMEDTNFVEILIYGIAGLDYTSEDAKYLADFVYSLLKGEEVNYEEFVFNFAEIIDICDEEKIDYYLNDYKTNGYTTIISDFIRESLQGADYGEVEESIVDIFEYLEKFPVQGIDFYTLKDIAMVALENGNNAGYINPMLYLALGFANSVVDDNMVSFVETNQIVEMFVGLLCQELALSDDDTQTLIDYVYALIKGEEVDYEQLITDVCVMFNFYDEETITNYINQYNETGTCTILTDFLEEYLFPTDETKEALKNALIDLAAYFETVPVDGFNSKPFEEKALVVLDEYRKVAIGGELMFADLIYAIYHNNPIGFLEDYQFIEILLTNVALPQEAKDVVTKYFYDLMYQNSIDYEQIIAKLCDAFGWVEEETITKYINQYKENGYITILTDYFAQVDFENDKAYEPFIEILSYVEKISANGLNGETLLRKIRAFVKVEAKDKTLPENLKFVVRLLSAATNLDENIKGKIQEFISYYQIEIENILTQTVGQLILLEVDSDGYKSLESYIKNLVYSFVEEDEIDTNFFIKEFNKIVDTYCEENIRNNVKSIQTVALIMLGEITEIDYNDLFAFVELPPAFEIEDYNKFIDKLTENNTYADAIKISDVKVQYLLDDEENIIGQVLKVDLKLNFDVMIASVKGDISLNIKILF